MVIAEIIKAIAISETREYAIISTDYCGGRGKQSANVFIKSDKNIITINQAIRYLGVHVKADKDKFDTIDLNKIRSQPEHLENMLT